MIRAKRKFLTVPVLHHLIKLDSPLKKKYIDSLNCSSYIKVVNGKSTSRYCKRIWCSICAPIRTAVRINNYKIELDNLGALQFTTLTMPNCAANDIKLSVAKFRSIFRQYRDSYNKRTGTKFRGVYNFEVTQNLKTKLYHPHIHIIHEQILQADSDTDCLIDYWLKRMPNCSYKGQDTRPCTALIEGFKYQSKCVFKLNVGGKNQVVVPVKELDQVFQQLQGVRCFQPFGIKKIAQEREDKQMDELEGYDVDNPDGVYVWKSKEHDWVLKNDKYFRTDTWEFKTLLDRRVNKETNFEVYLTGFIPSEKLIEYREKLFKNAHYN